MEELQSRHRKELRDLQSQVTQKKKQASKKTRKAVNEECERLERELKERQEREVKECNGEVVDGDGEDGVEEDLEALTLKVDGDEPSSTNGMLQTVDDISSNATSEQQGKKRNRQKDRLARRAAEQAAIAEQAASEAQSLPDLKELERTRMLASMNAHHLREVEIRADGHCLYSAVADQLKYLDVPIPSTHEEQKGGKGEEYKSIRAAAASWILAHPSDFEPFLEEPLNEYVHKVKDTAEWGGQVELLALARTLETDICVLQDYGRVERIEGGNKEDGETKEMWLGYYKHGFGLGEHYNSLRKVKKDGG